MPDSPRDTSSPAQRRVTVAGVRLHYRVSGRGQRGVPVVCVPQPGDSSGSLVPLVREIGQHQLCFALDLPGHGRSGNPPFGRRDPSWWLLAWLERLRFERCHLVVVGGSAGVAADAAQRSPKDLASITMIAPPPLRRPGRISQAVHLAKGVPDTPRSPRVLGSIAARLRSQLATDFRRSMEPRNLERDLRYVSVPVLVLRGERDTLVSQEEADTLARIARGTSVELPGAPRASHLSHPTEVATTLRDYWTSLEHAGERPGKQADQPAQGASSADQPAAADDAAGDGDEGPGSKLQHEDSSNGSGGPRHEHERGADA